MSVLLRKQNISNLIELCRESHTHTSKTTFVYADPDWMQSQFSIPMQVYLLMYARVYVCERVSGLLKHE